MRILIADDHPLTRIGFATLLNDQAGAQVEQVGSISELRRSLENGPPDALVLDLSMGDANGLDVIPELRRKYPGMGILVFSMHPEAHAGVRAMLSGAHGYLSKTSAPEELAIAVRQIAQGAKRFVSAELGAALVDHLLRSKQGRLPHETLSGREYTVLLRIAEGLTTTEIAAALQVSPKTIGTYRARVLEKMGLGTTAELTRYVVENALAHAVPRLPEG